MAAVVTQLSNQQAAIESLPGGLGQGWVLREVSIALDASYPTGGEAIAASAFGLGSVVFVFPAPTSGYVFEYDYTNSKLLAYYADDDAVADGALIQVPNTTDLSALTAIRALVIGRA